MPSPPCDYVALLSLGTVSSVLGLDFRWLLLSSSSGRWLQFLVVFLFSRPAYHDPNETQHSKTQLK